MAEQEPVLIRFPPLLFTLSLFLLIRSQPAPSVPFLCCGRGFLPQPNLCGTIWRQWDPLQHALPHSLLDTPLDRVCNLWDPWHKPSLGLPSTLSGAQIIAPPTPKSMETVDSSWSQVIFSVPISSFWLSTYLGKPSVLTMKGNLRATTETV